MHGVPQLVFTRLNAMTKALIAEHRWSQARAVEWVQSFLQEARVPSRRVAEYDAFEASAEAKKINKLPWRLVLPCGGHAIVGW